MTYYVAGTGGKPKKNKRPAVRVSRFKISEEPFSRIKSALGRIQEKA